MSDFPGDPAYFTTLDIPVIDGIATLPNGAQQFVPQGVTSIRVAIPHNLPTAAMMDDGQDTGCEDDGGLD